MRCAIQVFVIVDEQHIFSTWGLLQNEYKIVECYIALMPHESQNVYKHKHIYKYFNFFWGGKASDEKCTQTQR